MTSVFLKAVAALSLIAVTESSLANTVYIDNVETGSSIGYFGYPDTQTYGQVFSAPMTGILTSFTLGLSAGVGTLYGGVDGWSGGTSYASGYGSTGNFYTSNSLASSGPQSYTFNPNINVVEGQFYVAYISVFGEQPLTSSATMPLGDSSDPYIHYFVFNNTTAPQDNSSWNYFANFGNAKFTATFTSAVPEPKTYATLTAGLLGLISITRRHKR